jgi:hypothetical protein
VELGLSLGAREVGLQVLFFEVVFGILCALLPKDGKSAAENRDRKTTKKVK